MNNLLKETISIGDHILYNEQIGYVKDLHYSLNKIVAVVHLINPSRVVKVEPKNLRILSATG